MSFNNNDVNLYSCGLDGIVYEWNLLNGQRIEKITKGSALNDLFYDQENDNLYLTAYEKNTLVQLNEREKQIFEMNASFSKIIMDSMGKYIFLGVNDSKDKGGVIKYVKSVFKGEV